MSSSFTLPGDFRAPVLVGGVQVFGPEAFAAIAGLAATMQPARPDPARSLAEAEDLLMSMPEATMPPPAGILGPKNALPLGPLSDFAGREAEFTAAAGALRKRHGVALVGPPGSGKSQLAAELAHRLGKFFAGGVFWLSCEVPDHVGGQVATCAPTLGIAQAPDAASAVRALWDDPVPRLLVFDNCEDAAVLEAWLPTLVGCRAIVTSQRGFWDARFDLSVVKVGALPALAAVALLRKFADLPSGASTELAAIAEALDRMPLALKIAGAALAGGGPGAPAAWLKEMANNPLPALDRSFSSAWRRLAEFHGVLSPAQQVLRRAACFAAGEWLPRALLGVAADDAALSPVLQDGVATAVRAGMLNGAAGEGVTIHRQFARFVRETSGEDLAELRHEAAAALCAVLQAADVADVRLLPHLAIALSNAADPGLAGRLHVQTGRILQLALFDFEGAATHFAQAKQLAEHPGSEPNIALGCWADWGIGSLAAIVHQFEVAANLLAGAYDSYRAAELGEPKLLARLATALLGLPQASLAEPEFDEFLSGFETDVLTELAAAGPALSGQRIDLLLTSARRVSAAGRFALAEQRLASAFEVAADMPGIPAANLAVLRAVLRLALADVREAGGDTAGRALALAEAERELAAADSPGIGPVQAYVLCRQRRFAEAVLEHQRGRAEAGADQPLLWMAADIALAMQALDRGALDLAEERLLAAGAGVSPDPALGVGGALSVSLATAMLAQCRCRQHRESEARTLLAGLVGSDEATPQQLETLLRGLTMRNFPAGPFVGWFGSGQRIASAIATLRLLPTGGMALHAALGELNQFYEALPETYAAMRTAALPAVQAALADLPQLPMEGLIEGQITSEGEQR